MLASALSNQVGAAVGAHAFGAVGPAGVVAVRQVVAAAVLLPVARPPLRRMTGAQWWPVLLLAVVFGCMNLALYTAIDRLGLGLAVTLEFLGPLGIALAGSRSRRDLLIAVAAAAGVYVLVLPGPSSDVLGLAIGAAGGACWAAYIVLNRLAGARLPGLAAPAVAAALCAIAYAPVLVLLAVHGRLTGAAVGFAVVAGVLASVVPYAVDLSALRYVPARFFGVFMSVHPVLAALVGMVLLDQFLALHEWIGIAVVVLANAVAVGSSSRAASGAAEGPVDAEVLRSGRRVALEAGTLVVGSSDGLEEPAQRAEVADGRGVERLLDEVVARDVDGVDPVHRGGVRAESAPALQPAVDGGQVQEQVAGRIGVPAGGAPEGAEERGVVDVALLELDEEVVDQRCGHGAVQPLGQTELGPHPR